VAEGPDELLDMPATSFALERRLVAAAEGDEILPRRLRACPAHRAVEQDLALSRERGTTVLLRLERQRAALDDDLLLSVA
jgi:hypothetical protein